MVSFGAKLSRTLLVLLQVGNRKICLMCYVFTEYREVEKYYNNNYVDECQVGILEDDVL